MEAISFRQIECLFIYLTNYVWSLKINSVVGFWFYFSSFLFCFFFCLVFILLHFGTRNGGKIIRYNKKFAGVTKRLLTKEWNESTYSFSRIWIFSPGLRPFIRAGIAGIENIYHIHRCGNQMAGGNNALMAERLCDLLSFRCNIRWNLLQWWPVAGIMPFIFLFTKWIHKSSHKWSFYTKGWTTLNLIRGDSLPVACRYIGMVYHIHYIVY